MTNILSLNGQFDPVLNDLPDLQSLIKRMGLLPSLIRRLEEESIAKLIDIDSSFLEQKQADL